MEWFEKMVEFYLFSPSYNNMGETPPKFNCHGEEINPPHYGFNQGKRK